MPIKTQRSHTYEIRKDGDRWGVWDTETNEYAACCYGGSISHMGCSRNRFFNSREEAEERLYRHLEQYAPELNHPAERAWRELAVLTREIAERQAAVARLQLY